MLSINVFTIVRFKTPTTLPLIMLSRLHSLHCSGCVRAWQASLVEGQLHVNSIVFMLPVSILYFSMQIVVQIWWSSMQLCHRNSFLVVTFFPDSFVFIIYNLCLSFCALGQERLPS